MVYPLVASNGHRSLTYFSAASRTIQATDTFCSSAIFSNVWKSSGGKPTDIRVMRLEAVSFFLLELYIVISRGGVAPLYTTSVNTSLKGLDGGGCHHRSKRQSDSADT